MNIIIMITTKNNWTGQVHYMSKKIISFKIYGD